MRDDVLLNIQKLSKERHNADIKDLLFVEVPVGKLKKKKKYHTQREDAEKAFLEKQERIKKIAECIDSKL